MSSIRAVCMLLVAVGFAEGCKLVCSEGCNPGKVVEQFDKQRVTCTAGERVEVAAPDQQILTSCQNRLVAVAEGSKATCTVEGSGFTAANVACIADGECELDWARTQESCVCGKEAESCEGESCGTAAAPLPVCAEGEELAEEECTVAEKAAGVCRNVASCCVVATCRVPAEEPAACKKKGIKCGKGKKCIQRLNNKPRCVREKKKGCTRNSTCGNIAVCRLVNNVETCFPSTCSVLDCPNGCVEEDFIARCI